MKKQHSCLNIGDLIYIEHDFQLASHVNDSARTGCEAAAGVTMVVAVIDVDEDPEEYVQSWHLLLLTSNGPGWERFVTNDQMRHLMKNRVKLDADPSGRHRHVL